ncbi:MAG: TRAP transporter fused permease subunit [Desulfobacterales bacterium]|nr:TRAP transporter fused permease subunit [Desulfobacterales bacterium]
MGLASDIFSGGRLRGELDNPALSKGVYFFSLAIALYHLIVLARWYASITEVHSLVHLSSLLLLCFLTYSFSTKKSTRLPLPDLILLLLTVAVTIFFSLRGAKLFSATVLISDPLTSWEFVFGVLFLLLIFEGARRTAGLPFILVIFCFLLIIYLGPYLPGQWAFSAFSWKEIIGQMVYSPMEGIWGIPLRVSASYIILFFMFGKLMEHSGIGNLIVSLAQIVAGRSKGGPAKVAVIGSGLLGSVTAGPATNIVMTGTFTIPMMKEIGYRPHYAGAVECAASTGASIVPPVMTGIAFIMAQLAGVRYVDVMLAAILPAFLYYLGIILQVHFQAIKKDLGGGGEKKAVFKELSALLKERGHLLLPILLLIVLLLIGYTPTWAALCSIAAVVPVTWIRKNTGMGLKKVLAAFEEASQASVIIATTLSLSGIVLVSLFITGLGGLFSHQVGVLSGGSLVMISLLAGTVSLILGMAGPIIGSYLITVLIVGPVMVEAGLPTMVSHFFALYFANIAFITPPVAIGAFVAAGIANASFWRIGITAVQLAIAAFTVPFVFVFRPALLMIGSPVEILVALAVGMAVITALASALEGWLLTRLNGLQRLLLATGAVGLIPLHLAMNIGAILLLGLVLVWQVRHRQRHFSK